MAIAVTAAIDVDSAVAVAASAAVANQHEGITIIQW